MAQKNISITISMKQSDADILNRIQAKLAKMEGGKPSLSSIFRRGLKALGLAIGVR